MAKRILTALLAVMLLASLLSVSVFATEENGAATITITINNDAENHVYEAYQVFTGTLNADGIFASAKWGNGVDGDSLLTDLKSNELFEKEGVNHFANCVDAMDVARELGAWSYNETPVKNFADVVSSHLSATCYTSVVQGGAYVITVPTTGYYFIKDAQAVTGNDGATDYLLQVVKSVEVTPKVSAPTFSKSVNNELNITYVPAIDAQIGDKVYFKLETKLPSLYNDYKQYRMIMQDKIPDGLTFNAVEDIYIAHAAGGTTSYFDNYTLDNTIGIELEDGKKYGYDEATSTLTVNFGDLKITQANPNLNDTFVVKYSAFVNSDAVYGKDVALGNVNNATLLASNDMNQTAAEAATASLGSQTASASVYTYQMEVTKQDSLSKAPLANAEFYLYRNIVNPADNSTTKTYAHTDADGVITHWSAETPALKLISGSDGKFTIKGLDSLAYHLEEVTPPSGYNEMEEDVLVTLSATIDGRELTELKCTADSSTSTGNVATGLVAVAVNNTMGNTLPATGGMGTTVFYIAGAAMLLAVAVIMVSKKRREA